MFFIFYDIYVYISKYKKMNKISKKNKLINIRVDENLLTQYKEYCIKNGYDISKRIRLYIAADLDKKLEGVINE
jgi:predicted DNA binding CopG/RHH family protein